jgi:hypothetical protein
LPGFPTVKLRRYQSDDVVRQHGYANLGYWIRRSEWGKGYGVTACVGAGRFGFEQLRLIRNGPGFSAASFREGVDLLQPPPGLAR